MSEMNDFNSQVIAEFRANDGKVGGPFEGAPIVLLHTTGAKSGAERETPVMGRLEGDRVYVFASKAGAPTNPDWFHNLVAQPSVTVELGTEVFGARAVVVDREERDRVYTAQAADFANFAEYEKATDRVIPVVRLERT